MDACSRTIQTIAEYEFLGPSLRKINDNFQILDVNACEVLGVVESLSSVLGKVGVPPKPKCSVSSSNASTCNVVNIPPANTCVTDTRVPLNTSFDALGQISCALVTSVRNLSAIVINHPIGKLTVPAPTTPQCFFTEGIGTDEFIGDSYQSIINNFKHLESTYCDLIDKVNSLSSRICCPGDVPKRQDLLNRFTLQGEGGYEPDSFNFVDKGIMYATADFKNSYYDGILGAAGHTTYAYTTSFNGITYYGLKNILRMCTGNANSSAIFRDGMVFTAGETPKGPHYYPWIKEHLHEFKDIFMPSSYGGYYLQAVLLTSGNLYELDLDGRYDPPTLIMSNVDRFICINQSHSSDFIVATTTDEVWHIELNSGSWSTGSTAIQHRKNQILAGPGTSIGLKASEVEFMQLGDGNNSCYVCYTADKTKVYNIAAGLREAGHGPAGLLAYVKNTPYTGITLTPGEYFIDGSSNECHYTFLTNKHVHTFRSDTYGGGFSHTTFSWAPGVSAIRMATATSYYMSVQLTDGFYKLDGSICAGGYTGFTPFVIWNTLVQNLSTGRPDIFGFGTLSCCSCNQPLPPTCTGLSLEDFVTCITLENGGTLDLE